MSYSIQLLPVAQQDLIEIARYLSQTPENPAAANRLADQIEQALERLSLFPYSNTVYHPIKPLKQEYRRAAVSNYLIFYWVDEPEKTITVARVLYARRDIDYWDN